MSDKKIEFAVTCCGGQETCRCHPDICPLYREAKQELNSRHTFVATGFGSLYPDPKPHEVRERVRLNLAQVRKVSAEASAVTEE